MSRRSVTVPRSLLPLSSFPADAGPASPPRRRVLRALGATALAGPAAARAWAAPQRALGFYHTHTGETLTLVYFEAGAYVPAALVALNRLLRDFRTEEIHPIDPRLFDTLHALNRACGSGTFEIISGYRSERTNTQLRAHGGGVAKRSLHLQGRALDIRLRGRDTRRLRDAAVALQRGGVGYYAGPDFVHVDSGPVRAW